MGRPAAGAGGDPPGGNPPGGRRATYRGVRWRWERDGTVAWYNEGLGRWVRWRPGGDAPPVPPRWADEGLPPPPPRLARAKWRSPYRIVPVVLAVAVVGIGAYQALRSSGSAARNEAKATEALLGHCLARTGGTDARPTYGTTAVPCTSKDAAVRVVAVLPGAATPPRCPAGSTPLARPYPGVRYPHVECVRPVP